MYVVTDMSREAGGGVTGWGNDVDMELVGLPDSGGDRAGLPASSAVALPSHRAAAAPGSAQHSFGHGPQNRSVFPTGRSTKSPALSVSKHVGASATGKVAQVAVPQNRVTISFDEVNQQANISIFHAEQSAYEDSQQRNASSRRQTRTKSPNTGQKGRIFLAPSFPPVESSYLPGVVPTITGLKRTAMSPNSDGWKSRPDAFSASLRPATAEGILGQEQRSSVVEGAVDRSYKFAAGGDLRANRALSFGRTGSEPHRVASTESVRRPGGGVRDSQPEAPFSAPWESSARLLDKVPGAEEVSEVFSHAAAGRTARATGNARGAEQLHHTRAHTEHAGTSPPPSASGARVERHRTRPPIDSVVLSGVASDVPPTANTQRIRPRTSTAALRQTLSTVENVPGTRGLQRVAGPQLLGHPRMPAVAGPIMSQSPEEERGALRMAKRASASLHSGAAPAPAARLGPFHRSRVSEEPQPNTSLHMTSPAVESLAPDEPHDVAPGRHLAIIPHLSRSPGRHGPKDTPPGGLKIWSPTRQEAEERISRVFESPWERGNHSKSPPRNRATERERAATAPGRQRDVSPGPRAKPCVPPSDLALELERTLMNPRAGNALHRAVCAPAEQMLSSESVTATQAKNAGSEEDATAGQGGPNSPPEIDPDGTDGSVGPTDQGRMRSKAGDQADGSGEEAVASVLAVRPQQPLMVITISERSSRFPKESRPATSRKSPQVKGPGRDDRAGVRPRTRGTIVDGIRAEKGLRGADSYGGLKQGDGLMHILPIDMAGARGVRDVTRLIEEQVALPAVASPGAQRPGSPSLKVVISRSRRNSISPSEEPWPAGSPQPGQVSPAALTVQLRGAASRDLSAEIRSGEGALVEARHGAGVDARYGKTERRADAQDPALAAEGSALLCKLQPKHAAAPTLMPTSHDGANSADLVRLSPGAAAPVWVPRPVSGFLHGTGLMEREAPGPTDASHASRRACSTFRAHHRAPKVDYCPKVDYFASVRGERVGGRSALLFQGLQAAPDAGFAASGPGVGAARRAAPPLGAGAAPPLAREARDVRVAVVYLAGDMLPQGQSVGERFQGGFA